MQFVQFLFNLVLTLDNETSHVKLVLSHLVFNSFSLPRLNAKKFNGFN